MFVVNQNDTKPAAISKHIEYLSGIVINNTTIIIDNTVVTCLENFNVYEQLQIFKDEKERIKGYQLDYVTWLDRIQLVKIEGIASEITHFDNYSLTPISPPLQRILKCITILSYTLPNEDILKLKAKDVYYYTIGLEFLKSLKINDKVDPLTNVALVIEQVSFIVKFVQKAWYLAKKLNTAFTSDMIDSLTFCNAPLSQCSAFSHLLEDK